MKKVIIGYPDYYIYDDGRVYNRRKKRFIAISNVTRNYKSVILDGKRHQLHRLMCMNFKTIDNPENFVVNHIDEDPTNNHISNLEWCTQKENVRKYYYSTSVTPTERKRRHELMMKPSKYIVGKKRHNSHYPPVDIDDLLFMRKNGVKTEVMMEKYGYSRTTINFIIRNHKKTIDIDA